MHALRTSLARPGLAAHADALLGRHAFLRTGLVRRLASPADALLGSEVFTKLPATKTVLCVVATSHNNKSALGLAVTDPYLGHARALPPLAWKEEAIKQIAEVAAEHDAGALAFALPLADDHATVNKILGLYLFEPTREDAYQTPNVDDLDQSELGEVVYRFGDLD